jgi:hypothetical protein
MVGAGMFLPDNAVAEKNELSGEQNSQKASAQANTLVKPANATVQHTIPAKAENAKSLMKTAEEAKPAQGDAKQQPAKITLPQAASEKPAAALQNLPDQAKGNGQSAIKMTEKDVKSLGIEKAAVVQGNKSGLEKSKPTQKNAALYSFHQTDTEVETSALPSRLIKNFEVQGNGSRLSLSKKKDSFEPLVLESQKEGQDPASKEEFPTVNQEMNPTQRTNSSGGQSNDRVSNGVSTVSLINKWFEWNKHYEVKLIRSYHSRQILLNNQWVNAPPFPPPQGSPLFKTVNRS